VIQSDLDPERARLRDRDLEQVFRDAVELLLRGLRVGAPASLSAGVPR
jgi:hypothetical protein